MSQDAVSRFLLEEYGYGRINEVLKKHKGTGVCLDEIGIFFDKTIIGTYDAFGVDFQNPEVWQHKRPPKSLRFPGIPQVRTTEESVKKYGSYGFRIRELPYHVISDNFLVGYSRKEVEDYWLKKKVKALFPDAKINHEKGKTDSQMWHYQVIAEDFGLFVEGSSKPNKKKIIVDFCSSIEFKDSLHELIGNYWKLINQIKL
ncbi:MAG: hypothetical protein V3U72_02200 [Candidatus Aenigmarchaeota archaeon]